ncbi:hypothetical protein M409DRAFT_27264 [Zasmidium cellare ATCC 36951]|uniref:DUF6594 domain-containing protein n=1 Tax=Zasmidium cellare ATCC 36951 TaxID=1080233 RepID=A0A6A6C5D9_ZASCE|nr:uncharacterized protein M409DRAFT_27264 [Zasmidium cellare ATCC 36951]KAF2162261.1 hypothetical protein M409DRAFT_27264 [Zasmidium cellare ATCC 36951]
MVQPTNPIKTTTVPTDEHKQETKPGVGVESIENVGTKGPIIPPLPQDQTKNPNSKWGKNDEVKLKVDTNTSREGDRYIVAKTPERENNTFKYQLKKKGSETVDKEELDESPEGYPQVTTLMSSDHNFLQFRSFSYLHTRLILALQQDVEMLERQLDGLDEFDASEDGNKRKLLDKERDDKQATVEQIANPKFHFKKTRPQVICELREKLMEYDNVLLKAKEVLTLQTPSSKDYQSVRGWLMDEQPLIEDDIEYILHKEDIITLRTGRESAAFDSFVERVLTWFDRWLQNQFNWHIIHNIFRTPELKAKTASKRIHYYAPNRLDILVNTIITFIIFTLMVLPVLSLFQVSNNGAATPYQAIGVLIVFTLLFGCAMSSLTKATRHELFAASAAYCAVLVVFISNFAPSFQGDNGSGR